LEDPVRKNLGRRAKKRRKSFSEFYVRNKNPFAPIEADS
jgi:hypothetical protein